MKAILDPSFEYVPPARQEQEGVLSRWLKQRRVQQDAERERKEKELWDGKVLAMPDNKRHAG